MRELTNDSYSSRILIGMMAHRIDTFDIVKGIGILLMIIGHSTGKIPYLRDFIFSFHMPLFFLVSGYFFKPSGWKDILLKNSKRLLVPYLFTAFIITVYMLIYAWYQHNNVMDVLVTRMRAIALGSGAPRVFGMGPAIGAIWFLLAMFWAHLFFNLALRTRFTFFICMSLAALSFALYKEVFLPLSIQPGMSGTLFLYIGYQARQCGWLESSSSSIDHFDRWNFFARKYHAVVLLFALWFTSFMKGKLEMSCDYYRLWYFDMIGAVAGTYLIYLLAQYIDRFLPRVKRILCFYGRYSLVVLCFHLYEMHCVPWGYVTFSSWGDYRLPLLWLMKFIWAFLIVEVVLHVPFLRRIFQIR